MTRKITLWIVSGFATLILASCNLPEVTPTAAQTSTTPTSFIESPVATEVPTDTHGTLPDSITAKNAGNLKVIHKAAVSNVQQVVWGANSKSLSLSTQNADASGTQLFGVTTLNVPDLTPKNIFSTQKGRISAIAVDGRTIAVIAQGLNSVTFYDLGAENTAINTITPGFLIGNVTFSPDLRYIAVTQAESWEVVIYSFVSGQEVIRLTGYETAAPVFDAGFNFSPQWMVWHSRGTIQLQEVETGKMGARFEHQDFVSAFALSKDGSLLASVAGITLTVWDASQGTALKTFSLTNPANAVAFSPDGNLLATGSGKSIDIREVTSGKLLVSLGGHFDQITTISFSPDGKYIATTGFDNQLYLWQVSQ